METCRIDFINVGFGQCIVITIETQSAPYTIVIDGGDASSEYYQEPARVTLAEYLSLREIQKIDLLIMTHCHKDHIGGILSILGKLPVRKVITNFTLPLAVVNNNNTPIEMSLEIYRRILDEIAEKQIVLEEVCEIISIPIEEYSLTIYPSKRQNTIDVLDLLNALENKKEFCQEILQEIDKKLNATALAVRLSKKGKSILLCTSDIPLEFWEVHASLLNHTEVINAPHHGDRNYLTQEILERVAPKHIVICADACGTYNLPSEGIEDFVKRYTHAEIHFTESKKNQGINHVISFKF